MLLAAQRRAWELYYMEMSDLAYVENVPRARCKLLSVNADPDNWYKFNDEQEIDLLQETLLHDEGGEG